MADQEAAPETGMPKVILFAVLVVVLAGVLVYAFKKSQSLQPEGLGERRGGGAPMDEEAFEKRMENMEQMQKLMKNSPIMKKMDEQKENSPAMQRLRGETEGSSEGAGTEEAAPAEDAAAEGESEGL